MGFELWFKSDGKERSDWMSNQHYNQRLSANCCHERYVTALEHPNSNKCNLQTKLRPSVRKPLQNSSIPLPTPPQPFLPTPTFHQQFLPWPESDLQQYSQSRILLKILLISYMPGSFETNSTTDAKLQPMGEAAVPQLTKFKPWVFRPKKVMFSLDEAVPARKVFATSHWDSEENRRYVEFLLKFRAVLEGERKVRRKWHLNRIMSKYVGTRSHEQCRSHHQKMLKNYRDVSGIIGHLRPRGGEESNTSADGSERRRGEREQEEGGEREESVFGVLAWGQECSLAALPFQAFESSDFI